MKKLLEEREVLKQERAHNLKEEGLIEQRDNKLISQKHKLKRKNRNFLKLVKRAKYNQRYFEEYEQLLIHKDYQRELYRQV